MLILNLLRKENGAPEETRTPNPQIRSLVLYPVELRVRRGWVFSRGRAGRQPLKWKKVKFFC